MEQKTIEKLAVGSYALAAYLMASMTGCAGMEVGGRLGVYRVDERREEQRTYRQALPLKCYLWADCSSAPRQAAAGAVLTETEEGRTK